jgi:hypothetical protein
VPLNVRQILARCRCIPLWLRVRRGLICHPAHGTLWVVHLLLDEMLSWRFYECKSENGSCERNWLGWLELGIERHFPCFNITYLYIPIKYTHATYSVSSKISVISLPILMSHVTDFYLTVVLRIISQDLQTLRAMGTIVTRGTPECVRCFCLPFLRKNMPSSQTELMVSANS